MTHTHQESFLEQFDLLADRITIRYQGRRIHPSKCGGALTLFLTSSLMLYFFTNVLVLINQSGDEYF